MTLMTTVPACASCGKPATHHATNENEERCEACAIRYGYEKRGEAYAAMKTLGFAISLLRAANVPDDAITGMVQTILTDPHSTGEYGIGGDQFLPGPDRTAERPWLTGHVPLATKEI
jgi:uncharacterized protein (DUF983 family)